MPVALMLATLTDRRDFSHDWLLERKSDGERCIARKLGGDVRLESRTGRDLAGTYPEAHQVGSGANRRNTSGTWTRHSYPLTPVLRCGRCGSTMHGEISSNNRRTAAYYACHAARRNRSATMPRGLKCDAGWIPASHLDTAIRDELQRCAPSDVMHAPYRQQLGRSLNRAHDPRALADAAIRRLDEQLARSRRLYEFGEYDWDTFMAKRAQIQQEQQRLRNEAAAAPSVDDAEWCRAQILDLLAAWKAADDGQRSRLLASLFESIEAEALPDRRLKLTAIPRGGWRRFFQVVVLERETGREPATSTLGRCRSVFEFARAR